MWRNKAVLGACARLRGRCELVTVSEPTEPTPDEVLIIQPVGEEIRGAEQPTDANHRDRDAELWEEFDQRLARAQTELASLAASAQSESEAMRLMAKRAGVGLARDYLRSILDGFVTGYAL